VTFHDAAVRARALLIDAGIQPDTAARDAELLARHALGWERATWLAHRGEHATDDFTATYNALIKRRRAREPVAYIRGVQEFWGREFIVTPDVLIPRPETELLIELANDYLRDLPDATLVDVGAGSGCIAVTLALEHPEATVYATDISEAALNVARQNASLLGATHNLHFVHGSLLADIARPIHLVVSNPPYVAGQDKAGLSPEVRDYEPAVALFGGDDGWRDIRALLAATSTALGPGGVLLMEVGYGQAELIQAVLGEFPGLQLDFIKEDLQGIPRTVRVSATE
jgi:release factor glutamine methyltransferase